MKLSPTAVVLALAVTGAAVLPIGDIGYALIDLKSPTRFAPGHGDYPDPAAGERLASRSDAPALACLTPDIRKPRNRIG